MSIHAADALMEIFGFKRVANYEKPLDNTPSLEDDGGLLNEGMKMSGVKNEVLEVVAVYDGKYLLQLMYMDTDEELCRHSEALAGYAVRDARITELEAENEALNIWRDLALQFDSHRMAALWHLKRLVADSQSKSCAELFLSEPPLAAHEVVAERDKLRAELAALNVKLDAPVAKQVVMPEALDRAFITGESCDGVYRVVIQSETLKEMQSVHNWIVRLNAADHAEGGV